MAGYSGTPLPQKLGIREQHRVWLSAAPEHFLKLLGPLPGTVKLTMSSRGAPFDVIVQFATSRAKLASAFEGLKAKLDPAGGLWIAWPKRSSGVATDISEDVVRELALSIGLVDNKVCAIDDTWSGLRCVVRLQNRPKPTKKLKAQASSDSKPPKVRSARAAGSRATRAVPRA